MAKTQNRVLAWVLSLALALTLLPVNALAEGDTELGHLPGCGYQCDHVCDEEVCGYVEAVEGSDCTHVHDEDCGYEEGVEGSCKHVHDGTCGYAEAVEGSPCTHVHNAAEGCVWGCADGCPVATAEAKAAADQAAADTVIALINKLPEADELMDMDDELFSETAAAIGEASDAYDALSDAQKDLVTNYGKLEALLDILTPEVEPIDGTDPEETQYVAQIGEVPYETFAAAIEAVQAGETITLLKDCVSGLTKAWGIEKSITITGNYTVTFEDYSFGVKGDHTLTLDGCHVVINNAAHTAYSDNPANAAIMLTEGATLTLDSKASLVINAATGDGIATWDSNWKSSDPGHDTTHETINILNDSTYEFKNSGGGAVEDYNGVDYDMPTNDVVKIINGSNMDCSTSYSGIVATWDVYVEDSQLKVHDNSGSGSNGSNFYISKNSVVDFSNNGSHGLSAGNLSISNSKVTANGNGICGIIATGTTEIKDGSVITVKENKVACNVKSRWSRPGAVCLKGESTIASNCDVTITDNMGSGIYLWDENASLTMESGTIQRNTAERSGYGGGIYNEGGSCVLSSAVQLYNNHASTAGDDIYNADLIWRYNTDWYSVPAKGTLSFASVGSDWSLDGGPDCEDKITGWFDDSEGNRWEAHSTPLHTVEVPASAPYSATGLLALKAAHGVIPLEPDDPELPYDDEHSKSKTATELVKQEDGTYTSQVTLSLPSAQEELVTDVVFVLDKSTSPTLEDEAIGMLDDLKKQIEETGAKVKVGVVIFNKEAHVANDGNFFDLATEYEGIKAAIQATHSGGTNTHAGLLAGIDMLEKDTSVDDSRKYLIFVSDGITYIYNEVPTATAWSFNNPNATDDWHGKGSWGTFAGPDNWYSKYHTNNGQENWNSWISDISGKITAQGTTYEYPYGGTIGNTTAQDINNWDTAFAMSIDKALYLTYQVYTEAAAKYHCYAMRADTNYDYPWGPSFMEFLANGENVSFDDIQKDIYYLLDKGSSVKDYMGYVADDYNFDFVNDANQLTMKVGETTYPANKIEGTDNEYGFAPDGEGGYDYVLTYVQDDGKAGEHFVWTINVPVSNFAPVQLTYTVKLVNPKTAAGTYGEYDGDGSEKHDEGLYTNNSATLYPVDSNNVEGIPENFPKPTVSYTVDEIPDVAALSISKAVTGRTTDQAFTFTVRLTDDNNHPLRGTFHYTGAKEGDITLDENGRATVSLRHGQTISINLIPVGTHYTVTEDSVTGYTASFTGGDAAEEPIYSNRNEGQIVYGSGGVVAYTNVYNAPITTNTVTVYYRDLLTGESLATPYILKQQTDTEYNVIDQDHITIDGYTYVRTEGDALRGTLDSDKVITVYYTSNDAAPDLDVVKELTEVNGRTYTGGRVDTGDELTYTITVTNTGETVLENINVTDTLPSGLRLVSDDTDWTIDSLAPRASRTFTITATVRASAEGELLNNRVTAQCGDLTVMDNETVRVDEDYAPTPTPDPDPDRPSRPDPDPDRPGDGDDTTDIADEEVPLAELPGLNKEDHFAYIIGYEDGTVRPEGYITRAEVATIFFRLMTDEYRETYWATSNLFTDVAQANWYNNGVSTTANVGWIAGYPDGSYRPNNNITRAEFATIAARFLSGDYNGENMFTDIDGHWAADYINRAAAIGWITGYAGQFRPDDYITRAEAVTLINRMLDRAPDADHMLENMIRWPDNPETAWYYEAIQEATNSHDYDRETIIDFETWTVLLENRDWAALEELWAQAADATGGEVADNLTPDVPGDNN